MADIFIEWDRDRLVVAQGKSDGSKASIRLVRILERQPDSTDTLDIVDQLKQMFPSGSGRTRPAVTVVFPRQLVTIHRIQLPQVPDSEVAEMVRLQAAMRLTVPVESVCLDFTPMPLVTGSATRDVLLVTVPNDQVAVARRTMNDAGLELAEVRVSAFCVAQAAAQAGLLTARTDTSKVDIVALMRRDLIELTFVRGTAVVFSHSGSSWTSPDGIERAIRSELTRARMSAAESLGEHRIDRLILIGTPDVTSAVTDQIASRLDGAKLERIDPLTAFISGSLPDNAAATDLVTIAGAMAGGVQSTVEVVDLINPRKPPEKKDLRRVKILAATLAGLLVFAGGYIWRRGQIRSLTDAQTLMTAANVEIKEKLKAGEDELVQAAKVGAWVDRDIEWLDEIVKLQTLLPPTDRMFIDNFQFQTVQQNGTGTITLEGYAKSETDIANLARRLREAGYPVEPYEPEFRASAVSDYGVKVVLKVRLPEPLVVANITPRPKARLSAP